MTQPTGGRPQKYSDEELLADLRDVADIVGQSPSMNDYRDEGMASPHTIRDRFGDWPTAQSLAGLEARPPVRSGVSVYSSGCENND